MNPPQRVKKWVVLSVFCRKLVDFVDFWWYFLVFERFCREIGIILGNGVMAEILLVIIDNRDLNKVIKTGNKSSILV